LPVMFDVGEIEIALKGAGLPDDVARDLAADFGSVGVDIGPGRVHVSVMALSEKIWRVDVAAPDRRGLLAAAATVLADAGLDIVSGAAVTVPGGAGPSQPLALQRFDVALVGAPPDWDAVTLRLQDRLSSAAPSLPGRPIGAGIVTVDIEPLDVVTPTAHDTDRIRITVQAPDRPGLLWLVAAWLEANGCDVQVALLSSADGVVDDVLIVTGDVDAGKLEAHLRGDSDAGNVQVMFADHPGIDIFGTIGRVAGWVVARGLEATAAVTRRLGGGQGTV
jgi:hypothetical protein